MSTRSSSRKKTPTKAAAAAAAAAASPAASEKKPRITLAAPVRRNTNEKMSESVSFANLVFLAGQVTADDTLGIAGQTESVLQQIDTLLAASFSDKTKILRAEIFLKNLEDFAAFNAVWIKWIDGHGPARATVQANLVNPKWLVEIVITAAICKDEPKAAAAAEEEGEDEDAAKKAKVEEEEEAKE